MRGITYKRSGTFAHLRFLTYNPKREVTEYDRKI